ncbi:MAG: glutamate-5-semialdehyde dehydrogenase [Aquificaceae bacterium]|nr:glutamate-5-semialdehyde dehydrogenase [Aquificaceae bacterium]MDW8236902.1 glutamate-5-semialdehyde dehydrogenase [Aquificaceae bacterium]
MEFRSYAEEIARKAKRGFRSLLGADSGAKNLALRRSADLIIKKKNLILEENEKDLENARKTLSEALLDRLLLNPERIEALARALEDVALLPDPVGEITKMWVRPNGLRVGKMRVPIGVILIIYESRPNVTIEASALCIKSSNAIILRGGSEAINTNRALSLIMKEGCVSANLSEDVIQFVDIPDRDVVKELLSLEGLIDLVIPRGGESLIRAVAESSKVPVIKHYKGVCNIYIDEDADETKAIDIVYNAKVQRPSVCNAVENLVLHKSVLNTIWPKIALVLQKANVELLCDEESLKAIEGKVRASLASEEDYYEEFLSLKLSVKSVSSFEEAIEFIQKYGSGHSDAIVTENYQRAMEFLKLVDSSAVFVNASTRFNDGGELGLGAEMGISTDKLHARGPMGLEELTTQKFVILGNGQVRGNFRAPRDGF